MNDQLRFLLPPVLPVEQLQVNCPDQHDQEVTQRSDGVRILLQPVPRRHPRLLQLIHLVDGDGDEVVKPPVEFGRIVRKLLQPLRDILLLGEHDEENA